MKLIIDANALSDVFEPGNSNHRNFAPVKKCIVECKGVMYYGGTKFKEEIELQKNFFGLLSQLRKSGKLKELDQESIDKMERELKRIEPAANFDDPHLIACYIIGKIELICTNDKRADKYIKDPRFYPKAGMIPKIYRYSKQSRLLQKCF